MTDFISLFGIGVAAFVASNIDDTFILILLFVTPGLLARNVIVGQFLGIIILVIISSLAALLTFFVPLFILGFMGIIPIIIGIKRLLESREAPEAEKQTTKKTYLSFLSVMAIYLCDTNDINSKITIERLITDIDFKLIGVIDKLDQSIVQHYDAVIEHVNKIAEKEKLKTSLFELYRISLDTRYDLDKLREKVWG